MDRAKEHIWDGGGSRLDLYVLVGWAEPGQVFDLFVCCSKHGKGFKKMAPNLSWESSGMVSFVEYGGVGTRIGSDFL